MNTRVPDYFDEFHCLAGSCPDTCCGQWEIVVDPAARARYLSMPGPLGEQIRAALTTVDGEDCMVLRDGRCPLLTEDGLCPIVSQLGEDFLSTTCHTHPRFTEIYGGLAETMLSVSCPEAARLLLEREKPLTFVTGTDSQPPEPNDLDGTLMHILLESRETAFALVQDRSRPLSDRLALLLCFAHRLDRHYDNDRLCSQFSKLYRDPSYQRRQLIRIRRMRLSRNPSIGPLRELLLSMEHLSGGFPAQIDRMRAVRPDSVALEQLTVYFLFRWWLKAVCDGYIWRQAAAVVVSVLAVAGLAESLGDAQQAARLYSKEVEHSEDNLALLRKAMDLPQFSRNALLRSLTQEEPHAI